MIVGITDIACPEGLEADAAYKNTAPDKGKSFLRVEHSLLPRGMYKCFGAYILNLLKDKQAPKIGSMLDLHCVEDV